MALLRNSIRLWSRSARLFSTELQSNLDSMGFAKRSSRATPMLIVQQSDFIINQRIRNDEPIYSTDWDAIRKELISSDEFDLTERNIDMAIVNLCLFTKRIDIAMAYIEYLWDSSYDMNLSTMMTYLKLCYKREDRKINELEKKYLMNIYKKIRNDYPVMDALTAECCIQGITQTEKWKEAFELLKMLKVSSNPRMGAYSSIICTAFQQNEPETGWNFLREMVPRLSPDHSVYYNYLEYCKRNFSGEALENEIGKIVQFWGEENIHPFVGTINEYDKVLQTLGWSMRQTSIREGGDCRSCSKRLQNLKLSEEDFTKLARLVRDRVIIGADVYRKTTPAEYTKFLKFVERTKPYDIVIDGLNVSYISRAKQKPDGSQLTNIVMMCSNLGKKVLVLGRKHMLKWPKFNLNYVKEQGHLFLANDTTADDPYLLYATLSSGRHTKFISKDFMRQHEFLLEDPSITKIFKQWRMAHQIMPFLVPSKAGTPPQVVLKDPPKYLPVAQKTTDSWHIPFTYDPSPQPPVIHEPAKTWACFRKNRGRTVPSPET